MGNFSSITKASGEIAYASIVAAFDEYLAKIGGYEKMRELRSMEKIIYANNKCQEDR